MSTYKLIIKNTIKTDNHCFSSTYKPDGIQHFLKIIFNIFIKNKQMNVKNKFLFFKDSLTDNYLTKGKELEFIKFFYKIQKTYNILNRFVYNYKYKKSKIVVNTDIGLNELNESDKNVICIFDGDSRYLFNINDLIKIINNSLTNSYMFFSEPKSIKNPYNNLPFKKSILYNIYLFTRYKTDKYSELLFKFFDCDFNLSIFKFKNEYLLRDYSIQNYVYNSPSVVLEYEIRNMIKEFNKYCKKIRIKSEIIIHADFPKDKLIQIMKPYLLLFYKSQYSFHPETKILYVKIFVKSLIKFNKFNPQFGRKFYKVLYKTDKNFKKKVKGSKLYFNDNFVRFNNIEQQNNTFLLDHLNCQEISYGFTSDDNIYFDSEDELDEEDEEEEDQLIVVEEEEEEEDEDEEEEEEEDEHEYEEKEELDDDDSVS
jgi:hypothetical protein